MNLAQLRAFHAVAVHGGFSAAAQALGISQSAVTQHIKALEEAAGIRLFNRQAGGSELTAEGLDLWPKVRRVVLQLDEIGLELQGRRNLVGGHLSFGFCAPHLAMPLIGRFRAEYPAIRIRASMENSSRLLEHLVDRVVDVALATLREPVPGFVCHRLVTQRVLLLLRADHPWAGRGRVEVADLADLTLVAREPGSMTRRLFEAGLTGRGLALEAALVLDSREAVKEAVAAGLGVGYVLDHELGCDTRLVGLPIDGIDSDAGEYLVTLEASADIGSVKAFVGLALGAETRSGRAGDPSERP